jgi:hypothetical protein
MENRGYQSNLIVPSRPEKWGLFAYRALLLFSLLYFPRADDNISSSLIRRHCLILRASLGRNPSRRVRNCKNGPQLRHWLTLHIRNS